MLLNIVTYNNYTKSALDLLINRWIIYIKFYTQMRDEEKISHYFNYFKFFLNLFKEKFNAALLVPSWLIWNAFSVVNYFCQFVATSCITFTVIKYIYRYIFILFSMCHHFKPLCVNDWWMPNIQLCAVDIKI